MEAGALEEAGEMRFALISNALGRFRCCGFRVRSQQRGRRSSPLARQIIAGYF